MTDELHDADTAFAAALAAGDAVDDAVETSPDVVTESQDAPEADPSADAPAETPDAAPLTAPADSTPPTTPTPEPAAPFTVTVHGQPHAIPGLQWDASSKSFRVQDDRTFSRVQNLLTKGREWETRGRQELHQTRRELETERSRKTETQAQAEAYLAEWQKLMELPEDQFYAFAQAARQEWPRVQAQAERAVAAQTLAEAQRLQQPPEPDPESIIEHAQDRVSALVQHMLQGQPWADNQTQQALTEWMQSPRVLGQFVFRAPHDSPRDGIRQGQWVADWDVARDVLVQNARQIASAYERAQRQAAEAARAPTSVAPVAQQNARVLQTAGKPAAASRVPSGSTTAPAPPTQNGRPSLDMDELDRMWQQELKRAG
jgi:hypothetical protein